MKRILLLLLLVVVTVCKAQDKELVFKYFEQFDNQLVKLADGPITTYMCYNDDEFAFTLGNKVVYYDIIGIKNAEAWNLPSTIYKVSRRFDNDEEYIQVFTNPAYGIRIIIADYISQWFYPQKLQ